MDIFVVDDEPLIAETLAIILRKQRYNVGCATEPFVAYAHILQARPRLLITDHSMPVLIWS